MSDVTKVRIEKDLNKEVMDHVEEFGYNSKKEFVEEAVNEKMERDKEEPSFEERINRLEEAIDLDSS